MGQSYLSLQQLRIEDVPQHPEFISPAANAPTLTTFLAAVFREALREDFETGFREEGSWAPTGKAVQVAGLEGGHSTVPVQVEQRKKGKGENTWFARRSKHLESDVQYTELVSILMNNHSWWEYQYTPGLYDGNLLLEWDVKQLEEATSNVRQELGIADVEMRSKLAHHNALLIDLVQMHNVSTRTTWCTC